MAQVAMSLVCNQCGASLKSMKEAQDHSEATGHVDFAESTEKVLNLVCKECGKPCRSQTEQDLHTKRTGHTDFVDKTDEAAAVIDSEKQMKDLKEEMKELGHEKDGAGQSTDAEEGKDEEMVVPEVNQDLLKELEGMGFPEARCLRALHFSGNANVEAAVNWIVEHENDMDIDEPLLVKKSSIKPKLSPEEAKKALEEMLAKARAKREEEEKKNEKEREAMRIRMGKEIAIAKKKEEDLQLKRNLEARELERKEEARAREKIMAKLSEDRKERRRKLGLPEELTEEEKAAEQEKLKQRLEEEKKRRDAFVHVKPVTVIANLRESLTKLRRSTPDDAKFATCCKTLTVYCRNLFQNPSDEAKRRIRLSNKAFVERVASLEGATEFLDIIGFKSDGDFLMIAENAVNKEVLEGAGGVLNDALTNPFFGKF